MPGVEDERVEAAEPVDRLGDRALRIRLDARVGDDRQGRRPRRATSSIGPGRRPVTATA